jgi:electron transfer flavoprotein alpha subunit
MAELSDYKGFWSYAEVKEGKITPISYEALGQAKRLAAEKGAQVTSVLIGEGLSDQAQQLTQRGAERVIYVDVPGLNVFTDQVHAQILADLVEEERPEVLIGVASFYGKALFPRLAARLNTALASDVTRLELGGENGSVVATRPTHGGNVLLQVSCPSARPQLVTVRPKAFSEAELEEGSSGEVVTKSYDLGDLKSGSKVTEVVKEGGQQVSLTEADIIVSGGRGVKDTKNFPLIQELANAFDGAMGASRAAVDAGWIPYAHQVGQTGKTVNPKLYIACGISGAIQHLAGMQSSKVIVAINRDPEAPIFNVATFGIVGDLFEIVPALAKKVRETLRK